MAVKGDMRAREPLARKLYADGHSLADISRQLDVSETTLSRWKQASGVPGESEDGWDIARRQKRHNIQRLRDLFERQLDYVEQLNAAEVTAPMMDCLAKLGALIERWDKAEAVVKRLASVEQEVARDPETKATADLLRRIRQEVYGIL